MRCGCGWVHACERVSDYNGGHSACHGCVTAWCLWLSRDSLGRLHQQPTPVPSFSGSTACLPLAALPCFLTLAALILNAEE
jgi:hypothetical protein